MVEEKKLSLSGYSSAMITSQTSTPLKGESRLSTSAMLTSETATPIKEHCTSFTMERAHFNKIAEKLKEYGNCNNFTVEEDISSMNSFYLHSNGGNNTYSQDTGYQTESMSYNMTNMQGGTSSMSSMSRNWSNTQLKSVGEKHINEGFHDDKCNYQQKGSSVMVEDTSVWLPSSKHIISSTPTKFSN